MIDEIAQTKEFFKSHHLHFTSEWIESCIPWCKSEILGSNYTTQQLQVKVYEQWLLLDLRDLESPFLPPNISSHIKHTLPGTYTVQLMQVLDISRPKHRQLQEIRNQFISNAAKDEENQNGKRVLHLTLSDGVQEVIGIEYQAIKSLNLNLAPGIKIKLIGPISVRRGRLMLTESNVKVLGGEVEDLLIANAAENVLAKALGVELNQNPKVVNETAIQENNSSNINTNLGNVNVNLTNLNKNLTNKSKPESKKVVQNHISKPETIQNNDFDDMDFEMDDELFLEAERVALGNENNVMNVDFSSPPSTSTQLVKSPIPTISNPVNVEQKSIISPPRIPISISKIKSNLPNIGHGKFTIHAKFVVVKEKLTVKEDKTYNLVLTIKDASESLDVAVANDLVVGFLGQTAEEMQNKSKETVEIGGKVVPDRKFLKNLYNLKTATESLDDDVQILVDRNTPYPTIIKIFK